MGNTLGGATCILTCTSHTGSEFVAWMDKPHSQYKNSFIFVLTGKLAEVYSLRVTWNYFATSHECFTMLDSWYAFGAFL